jgi:hypothetical protein
VLTNSDVDLRVLSSKFPDRTLCESFRAQIGGQRSNSSGENLLSCNRIPVCPDEVKSVSIETRAFGRIVPSEVYHDLMLFLSHMAPILLMTEKFVIPNLVACLMIFKVPLIAA